MLFIGTLDFCEDEAENVLYESGSLSIITLKEMVLNSTKSGSGGVI